MNYCRKNQILDYLQKKTPDLKFKWHDDENWVSVYETVNTLNKGLNIPKSSIYKALKRLADVEGFSFSYGLVSYEYKLE